MVLISQLTEYSNILIRDIDGLNTLKEVVDIDHMNRGMSSIKREDNDVLYQVLPSYYDDIANADSIKSFISINWFVLRKITLKKGHDVFMDSFQETQVIAKQVRDHIYNTASGKLEYECGSWLRQVYTGGSLNVDPIYHTSGMNGWHITLTLPHYG